VAEEEDDDQRARPSNALPGPEMLS
jgi:hypothetical protein